MSKSELEAENRPRDERGATPQHNAPKHRAEPDAPAHGGEPPAPRPDAGRGQPQRWRTITDPPRV